MHLLISLCAFALFGCSMEKSFIYFPSRDIATTPRDVGLVYEDVTVTAEDNVELNGWFIPSPDADVTLLWFHGNAGNISHRVHNIGLLHNAVKAHIFIIDYRGYGRSHGSVSEEGTYKDARAAIRYLKSRTDIHPKRIVIFGRSLGAAVALDVALREDSLALILETPFTSIGDMAKTILPVLPIGPFLRTKYDNLRKIRQVRVPLLVLHGDRDEIVPYEHGKALFDAAPEPKQFYTIRNAGHNDTYVVGGDAYFTALADFISAVGRNQTTEIKEG